MNQTAAYWIGELGLQPHREGGYFRENYRAKEVIPKESLPERYDGDRHFSSSIYFLLQEYDFSAFHKLKSDEIWHFYAGAPLNIYLFDSQGELQTITLGNNIAKGEIAQVLIPYGHWFAAELTRKDSYCLAGCTASPAFEYDDFEMGDKKQLTRLYPGYARFIEKLTRE